MRAGKGMLIISAIAIILFGISYIFYPPESTSESENSDNIDYTMEITDEIRSDESLSDDPNINHTIKDSIFTLDLDELLVVEGGEAKRVESFKTLIDAERAMGYYLGLHNTIESYPNYKLVGVYSIGDGEWYQAIFEDETGEIPNITIKVSKEHKAEALASVYDKEYSITIPAKVGPVTATFKSSSEETWNVVYFDTNAGKAYTIFTSDGVSRDIVNGIVKELVSNLMIMDDWVN